jgi:hypothetical protein
MGKSNILFIITSDIFVRNYLTTDALAEVSENADITILASDDVTLNEVLQKPHNFQGYFSFDPIIRKHHFNLLRVLMWKKRKLSSSFVFRFLREIGYQNIYNSNSFYQYTKGFIKIIYNIVVKDRWFIYSILFGNKIFFQLFFRIFKNKLIVNKTLFNKVKNIKPDIVVVPSNAFDPIGNDIVRICKILNIKTLFLVDNWDNLSSKSVFLFKPKYLGVWGEQSKLHAIQIHNYNEKNIFIVGTPRFNDYVKLKDNNLSSHFDFDYILFVGCAIAFDETSALQVLEDEICKNRHLYGKLKIVYRPHPWRQTRISEKKFIEKNFLNIILDPQVSFSYNNKLKDIQSGKGFQPNINYYPSLLKNAKLVIGPLTTMLIESLILERPTLALAYDDGVHFTSPHNSLKYFIHFDKLDMFESLNFCENISLLPNNFNDALSSEYDRNKIKNDNNLLNYFVDIKEPKYPVKLNNLLNNLLKV